VYPCITTMLLPANDATAPRHGISPSATTGAGFSAPSLIAPAGIFRTRSSQILRPSRSKDTMSDPEVPRLPGTSASLESRDPPPVGERAEKKILVADREDLQSTPAGLVEAGSRKSCKARNNPFQSKRGVPWPSNPALRGVLGCVKSPDHSAGRVSRSGNPQCSCPRPLGVIPALFFSESRKAAPTSFNAGPNPPFEPLVAQLARDRLRSCIHPNAAPPFSCCCSGPPRGEARAHQKV